MGLNADCDRAIRLQTATPGNLVLSHGTGCGEGEWKRV